MGRSFVGTRLSSKMAKATTLYILDQRLSLLSFISSWHIDTRLFFHISLAWYSILTWPYYLTLDFQLKVETVNWNFALLFFHLQNKRSANWQAIRLWKDCVWEKRLFLLSFNRFISKMVERIWYWWNNKELVHIKIKTNWYTCIGHI